MVDMRQKEKSRKALTVWKRKARGGVKEERKLLLVSHG
jgi:hypothetical protein